MRSVRKLTKLRESVEGRVQRLTGLTSGLSFPLSPSERRAISYAVIELDNLVINCLRSFTRSVLVGCSSISGQQIATSSAATNAGEASADILRVLNSTKFSNLGSPGSINDDQTPTFRLPSEAEKIFIAFNASNLTDLQLAVGLNGLVFTEIKHLRHFFAHRCEGTNDNVRAFAQGIGIFQYEDAERLALTARPSTATPVLRGWMDDIVDFCALAM